RLAGRRVQRVVVDRLDADLARVLLGVPVEQAGDRVLVELTRRGHLDHGDRGGDVQVAVVVGHRPGAGRPRGAVARRGPRYGVARGVAVGDLDRVAVDRLDVVAAGRRGLGAVPGGGRVVVGDERAGDGVRICGRLAEGRRGRGAGAGERLVRVRPA